MDELQPLENMVRVLREGNRHLQRECGCRTGGTLCDACIVRAQATGALRQHLSWMRSGRALVHQLHAAVTALHDHAAARHESCEWCADLEAVTAEAHFDYVRWMEARPD